MEKTLKMGAFQALDSREMMETEGGYKFLDSYTPSTSSTKFTPKGTLTLGDALRIFGEVLGERKAAGLW